MTKESSIKLFEQKQVRTHWSEEEEKWYFSIIDIITILTEQTNLQGGRNYWKVLKHRLVKEGNETVTNCNRLKMLASDGKMRLTDVADTEQLLRLVQSVPSKKAEPFKQWLAKVGAERIDEIEDPELAFNRAMETYLKKGYSSNWINQRIKSIEIRKELTAEWDKRGVRKGMEYALLTDEITKAWSGLTTRQYKSLKGLRKESLRDNMTNLELVFNMLAEASTTEISKSDHPETFTENVKVAQKGGKVAEVARKQLESTTKQDIVTKQNAKNLQSNQQKKELK